jgi:hypothetical protein
MPLPKRYGPVTNQSLPQAEMYGRTNETRFLLRLAEVIRVDYENMVCDLAFLQGSSPVAEEVPLASAYWSKRGFLGAMPTVGSIVITGNTGSFGMSQTRPLILAFLPNGYKTALRFDPIGVVERNTEGLEVVVKGSEELSEMH